MRFFGASRRDAEPFTFEIEVGVLTIGDRRRQALEYLAREAGPEIGVDVVPGVELKLHGVLAEAPPAVARIIAEPGDQLTTSLT